MSLQYAISLEGTTTGRLTDGLESIEGPLRTTIIMT